MRISADSRKRVHRRICEVAQRLFAEKGFAAATTRDLSAAAGIAAGTLFNYFPSKDAIVVGIARQLQAEAAERFLPTADLGMTLNEVLFAHITAVQRALEPLRGYLFPALDAVICPLGPAAGIPGAREFRTDHLTLVEQLLSHRNLAAGLAPTTLHLYWALYVGILTFWVADASPHQEDTLALIDHSMTLFSRSLER